MRRGESEGRRGYILDDLFYQSLTPGFGETALPSFQWSPFKNIPQRKMAHLPRQSIAQSDCHPAAVQL
jgi:hypothetical protein